MVFPFCLERVGQFVDGGVAHCRTSTALRTLTIMPWASVLAGIGDRGHNHPRPDVVGTDDVAILVCNFDLGCLTFWRAPRVSQCWG